MASPSKQPVKIAVCIPSPEYVHMGFVRALYAMLSYSRGKVDFVFQNSIGSRISMNRNRLVDQSRIANATHVLFIDADMAFPHTAMLDLLAHDKDIVCATACKRGGTTALGRVLGGSDVTEVIMDGLTEMVFVGLPFMLIRMEVFDRLKKPYFAEPIATDDDRPSEMDLPLDQPWGEDHYFCKVARDLGYQIWCDFGLSTKIGHIGSKVYFIETYPQSENS